MEDPTDWIARHPRGRDPRGHGDGMIRIGLAHGSLNIMPLPEDDHLIRADAAQALGLDYLALGHWHKRYVHKSADGVERTAYCGTHEPMRFAGGSDGLATGWSSFSSDGDAERFHDDGHGTALLVTIEAPAAAPKIEPVEIGRLRWTTEERDLTSDSVSHLIADYSRRDRPERTLLRLKLSGVVEPREHARIDELKQIVVNRFHAGSSLNADDVLIQPSDEQLAEVVGAGVLKRVLERIQADAGSPDDKVRRISGQALKELYAIACEEQPR